ncbi:hypothetical protein ACFOWB_09480 [Chenggangzhangella methanolivorans]|uniref:hypothetical protein n=1 Tax=Chenggangzhangella methanolivorans TaxID=1437009 RepID=UPI00360622B3
MQPSPIAAARRPEAPARIGRIAGAAAFVVAGVPFGVALALWRSGQPWGQPWIGAGFRLVLEHAAFFAVCAAVAMAMELASDFSAFRRRLRRRAIVALKRRPWLLHLLIWGPLATLALVGGEIEFWRAVLAVAIAAAVLIHAAILRSFADGFGLGGKLFALAFGAGFAWFLHG